MTTYANPGTEVPRLPRRPLLWEPIPPTARACCCPATPVVQAVLPAAGERVHPVELLLCQHHYRRSRAALVRVNAVILDARGGLIMPESPAEDWPAA